MNTLDLKEIAKNLDPGIKTEIAILKYYYEIIKDFELPDNLKQDLDDVYDVINLEENLETCSSYHYTAANSIKSQLSYLTLFHKYNRKQCLSILNALLFLNKNKNEEFFKKAWSFYYDTAINRSDIKLNISNNSYYSDSLQKKLHNATEKAERKGNILGQIFGTGLGGLLGWIISLITPFGIVMKILQIALCAFLGWLFLGSHLGDSFEDLFSSRTHNKLFKQIFPEEQALIKTYLEEKEPYTEKIYAEYTPKENLKNLASLTEKVVPLVDQAFKDLNNPRIICPDIPSRFRDDMNALKKFKEYFDDCRVDNIKEAINLYIQEQRDTAYQNAVLEAQERNAQILTEQSKMLAGFIHEINEANENIIHLEKERNDLEKEKNETLGKIKSGVDKIKDTLKS